MAAFTHDFDYDANQLLFNLDVPTNSRNMMFKVGKPEPVIIEKFGPNTVPVPMSPLRIGNKSQSLQFSAISEDSLSMAVKLAKRDMQKQKEEDTMRKTLGKNNSKSKVNGKGIYGRSRSPGSPVSRTRSKTSPSRTKIVQSKGYKDKLKKRADRQGNNKAVPIREQERGRSNQPKSSQTRDHTPPGSIFVNNPALYRMPATTDSPPTRDTTVNSTAAGPPLTGDDKIMHEIKRLRSEMEKCMRQIKAIEQASRAAPSQPKSQYAEDIEEERKRKVRAEEQTTRSCRNIYMLNQQVKDIQSEVNKMNTMKSEGLRYSRKSQALSKLAAAHRGAVRVLQNLVTHLPDYDLKQGTPRNYQELGGLLQQLALCCARLEVVGQQGAVPDSVMYLLSNMAADRNKAHTGQVSTTRTKSPPRICQVEKAKQLQQEQQHRAMSPPRARSPELHYDREVNDLDAGYFESARRKEVGFQEEPEWKSASNSAFSMERMDSHEPIPSEREKALKAGIRSLVEAASNPPTPRTPRICTHHGAQGRKKSPVPPLNLPRTPRTDRTHSAGLPCADSRASRARSRSPAEALRQRNQKIKKGLLIPSNLQSARSQTSKQMVDLGEAHYAEPTYSSRSKEVLANPFNRPSSPVSPRRSGSPMTPRRHRDKTEVTRQVWEDREYSRRELRETDHRIEERQRIEDLSVRLGRSGEWVAREEKRIRAKLEPLLSQAEVELNADLLADMMLADIVSDTANELHGYQRDQLVTHDAQVMSDANSMETMLQKIKLMEDEQNAIRLRWAEINYEDEYEPATISSRHTPQSPQPIHLTRGQDRNPDPVTDLVDRKFNTEESSDGAIMFTKSKRPVDNRQRLNLSARSRSHERLDMSARRVSGEDYDEILGNILYKENRVPPIRVDLTDDILQSIGENKARFSAHLKKMNYQQVGRFNPWAIVEEIADEILADCFQDISKELWEINNEIVEHTYKQEFRNGGVNTESPNNSRLNDSDN